MRKKRQIEAELKHQKKLASQKDIGFFTRKRYETRIHCLSWVLGESTTF